MERPRDRITKKEKIKIKKNSPTIITVEMQRWSKETEFLRQEHEYLRMC